MIDFKKYGSGSGKGPLDPTDLLKLFESLDRKTSHTELRRAQVESLGALTKTRAQRDHVLKVSTGAGKTTVGLLYLRSHALETKQPVIYLCPKAQLVRQVLAEAASLGIKAVEYAGGQTHPDPSGVSGEAILVCTYRKVFTARTTFDRADVRLSPCAVVLDDAHAGVEEVRAAFTISLDSKSPLTGKLRGILESSLRAWAPGVWAGVVRDDPAALLEVPYWTWRALVSDIREVLTEHASDADLKFVWDHLRDRLEFCRCIIGGGGIEITPDMLPVETVRVFQEAKHRLFMSATLVDDSALVRELGCDVDAAKVPIESASDAGVGERMVLVPSLIDKSLNRTWLMQWCQLVANARVAVVALCPTKNLARDWEAHGAEAVVGDDVEQAIARLRDGSSKFAVFANRYDGVDLPDDACRVLVIDGVPFGESLTTRHDAAIPGRPSASQNRLVHRIEQGMGRAVRSHVDYAVVVLAGPDLASFLSRNDILTLLNPATRAQVQLASRLADISLTEAGNPSSAFTQLALACLKRDQSWKDFYDAEVRQVLHTKSSVDGTAIDLAGMERAAAKEAAYNPQGACDQIRRSLGGQKSLSDSAVGWYLQIAAGYLCAINQAEALSLQAAAYSKNSRMLRPPLGATLRSPSPGRVAVPAAILRWYAAFDNVNGAVAEVEALRAKLSFGVSPLTFEASLASLATILGAQGSQPERDYGRGPDNLWLWPDLSLVIECKNHEHRETLPKRDSGQLHDSLQWFKEAFPTLNATPIVVAESSRQDDKAHFPEGTRVITKTELEGLLNAVEKFVASLTKRPANQWRPNEVSQLALQVGVGPEQFIAKHTVALT